MFTLKENDSKAAVFKNGLRVLKHAEVRRNVHTAIVKLEEKLAPNEEWLHEALQLDPVENKSDAIVVNPVISKTNVHDDIGEPEPKKQKIKG